MTHATPLLDAFFARRDELRRYFAARVGEADADDLVQETYLRVADGAALADIQHPGAYLYRLASNIMLDRLRQCRARQTRDGAWHSARTTTSGLGQDVCDIAPADRMLIARDRLARLQAALRELPEPVQLTFRLHKFEDLSHSEIAHRLGISRSLVEKHMMRALRHLLAVAE